MNVTEFGIIIFFNDLHSSKAFISIDVTEEGIVISVNYVHSIKRNLSISFIGDRIFDISKIEKKTIKKGKILRSMI